MWFVWFKKKNKEKMASNERNCKLVNISYRTCTVLIFVECIALMIFCQLGRYCASDKYSMNVTNVTTTQMNKQNRSHSNLENIKFLINSQNTCSECKSGFFLVVLIHSALSHIKQRSAIRETWGKQSKCIKTLYFLGTSDDHNITRDVQEESEKFHDIVQGNFLDTYRNLTYKHIMVLKWATEYCREAKYIIKTDDDILVNIDVLYNKLKKGFKSATDLIACSVVRSAKVLRSRSKWIVTESEYPAPKYPNYCSGMFIIYSADVVRRLLEESYKAGYLWVDDVFVSGVLAARIGVKHVDLKKRWFLKREQELLKRKSKHAKLFMFGPRDQPPDKIYKLWKALKAKK